ncbi:MAG: rhomboid family intramembrane serine protease [Thermoplasmata archaeon]|nr:rhomboid family intramembrane serine protease [Thermoplasmata archaeon]
MLELLLIPVLIILSFLYVKFKKAYLTQVLIIANFAVFIFYVVVAQIGSPMAYSMAENLTFMPARLGEIQYLPSIITSMFMHADPIHLIGNCLVLYLIGLPLEERIGTRKWGIIYFATGIAATFSYYIMNIDSGSHLLGASGAIFGIGGAMLVLYPRDRIPMFIGPIFIRNAPVWLAVGSLFVIETVLVMMAVEDNVAHIAHVGGAMAGIILAPMLVKHELAEARKVLDIDVLRSLATTEEERDIITKVENEEVEDVRNAWLDQFFTTAKCPACSRKIQRASKIKCECGQEYGLMK